MTDDQKYAELLKALGEMLHDSHTTINMQSYQIDSLKRKLEEAENQIEELKKGTNHE